MLNKPYNIADNWEDWTSWTTCSRPCGGGVSTRTRTCDSGTDEDCGTATQSSDERTCNETPCDDRRITVNGKQRFYNALIVGFFFNSKAFSISLSAFQDIAECC